MQDVQLLSAVNDAKTAFENACGRGCGKYSGAVTVELIKQALKEHGILTSARDVFVRGVPIEIDLLIPRDGATPENGLLYDPNDVLAVFEVKNRGVMRDADLVHIGDSFRVIRGANPNIKCIYLTLSEWEKWKEGAEDGDGYRAFALFWHGGHKTKRRFDSTGSWQRLISYIKTINRTGSNIVGGV